MKMKPEHILGYAEVEIEGKSYKIEFTNGAMIRLQKKFGSMKGIAKQFIEFDLENINFILLEGLKKHHKKEIEEEKISYETIEELNYLRFLELVKGLSEAFGFAVPEEEKEEELPEGMKAFKEEAKKKEEKPEKKKKK